MAHRIMSRVFDTGILRGKGRHVHLVDLLLRETQTIPGSHSRQAQNQTHKLQQLRTNLQWAGSIRYCPSSAPCWPSACPGSACSLVGSFFLYPTGLGPVAGQHEVSSSGPCTWTWQAGSRHPRSLWRFLCSPHGNEPSSSLLTMEGQVLQKEKERGLC